MPNTIYHWIPVAVLADITKQSPGKLQKIYHEIIQDDCVPLTNIPKNIQNIYVSEYLLRDRMIDFSFLDAVNGSKIDVLRQIFDETDVPIIICGTYVLKDLISGERKKDHNITHNRPQIFRRLRKEEFDRIDEREILDYLLQLEHQYAVSFSSKVKNELVSICRDRQSGGLGNFIEIIELLFDQVRPKWKEISYQLMKESGRILHTHKEKSQSFKAIKHSKDDPEDTEKASVQVEVIPSPDKIPVDASSVDASSLPLSPIDSALLHDCLRHKMTM